MEGRIPNKAISQAVWLVDKAVNVINNAKKPVIISGFGAVNQGEKTLQFAEKISAPVITTFRGKGAFDENHFLYVGSHGGIGSTAASKLVQNSDLLIVIGSSLS